MTLQGGPRRVMRLAWSAIYKELPILGKDWVYATRVALAARMQEKYEEFHAAMMTAKGHIDQKIVLDIAAAGWARHRSGLLP